MKLALGPPRCLDDDCRRVAPCDGCTYSEAIQPGSACNTCAAALAHARAQLQGVSIDD